MYIHNVDGLIFSFYLYYDICPYLPFREIRFSEAVSEDWMLSKDDIMIVQMNIVEISMAQDLDGVINFNKVALCSKIPAELSVNVLSMLQESMEKEELL